MVVQSNVQSRGIHHMPEDYKTIREMCAAFGVTPRTLRFYEAKELLFPKRDGQHRLFTRRDQARLKLILRGKRFGFSLEQIRQLLEMYDRDDSELKQLRKTYDIAQDRLADMERQRAELTEAISELKQDLAWADDVLSQADRPRAAE
jgi:DNA-binding transcriptional MerR regulator